MRIEPFEVDMSHGEPFTVRLLLPNDVWVDLRLEDQSAIGVHLHMRTHPGRFVVWLDGAVNTLRLKATSWL